MEKMKACRGCFAEMYAEDEKCYKCGWIPGRRFKGNYIWKLGDILENRYLVGNIYYESKEKDIVVFYLYDRILSMVCMALVRENDEEGGYLQIAEKLKASKKGAEGKLIIQALKKVQGKLVLLFSLENRYMAVESFEICLESILYKEENHFFYHADTYKIENVLTQETELVHRYRIIDCIGLGGFGITYLCEDILLHRLVAIKEYFPAEWAERDENFVAIKQSKLLSAYQYGKRSFLKEIALSAKFIHFLHVPAVYDAFEANDTLYLVMEYIDGISVGRMMKLREYRAMTCKEVMAIILPVLDALEVMHDGKVIHSDISPGNILYTEKGEVYLIDMGAAKYTMDSQPPLQAVFLKTEYAAPEQYRTAVEKRPSGEGAWTDIYGVGATMYYMLTGEKPTDVISRLNGTDVDLRPKLAKKIPYEWAEILNDAMTLDKEKRIQSVPELKSRIAQNTTIS